MSLVQKLTAPVQRLTAIGMRDPDAIEIEAGVKDAGVALLTALVPDLAWRNGSAQISLNVRGTMKQPIVEGFAEIERGSVKCPLVKVRFYVNLLHRV